MWRQEVGTVTLRNLWEWWVQSLLSSCLKKDVQSRDVCFLYSFGLYLLYFPLCFGVRDQPPAHKVGEVLWDNPTDIIDLESPLKEGALTLLNSYFQKHKTYQLSHSILSNLLLPNCSLFFFFFRKCEFKWVRRLRTSEKKYTCISSLLQCHFVVHCEALWMKFVSCKSVKSFKSLALESSK